MDFDGRIVRLNISHNLLTTVFREIRFDSAMSILRVKEKIYTITGTVPGFCRLSLRDEKGELVDENLGPDDAPLFMWSPDDFYNIHVTDTNPESLARNGGLQDLTLVEKYVMDDETYDARTDTYRHWKREKLRTDPVYRAEQERRAAAQAARLAAGEEECRAIPLGSRCELYPGEVRGTVVWAGQLTPAVHGRGRVGWHVGIELDEPTGGHDGMVNGVRLFTCKKKGSFGALARPGQVKVGDYPVRVYFEGEEECDIEEGELEEGDFEECDEL